MRILSVADLHYTLPQLDWLKGVAAGFDVVLIPGDLLDIVATVPLDVQILVVRKYLRGLPKDVPVLVSSGNHDGDERNEAGEQVAEWLRGLSGPGLCADGESWERNGVLFTVCPWWDGEQSKAQVGDLLARDAARAKRRWIWLYHAPPAGSPLAWNGRKAFGDAALAGWIDDHQPDLVFTGHIHQAPFAKDGAWHDRIGRTLVFNAGKQIGPVPAFVEVDLAADTARWRSLAGDETIRLSTGQVVGP